MSKRPYDLRTVVGLSVLALVGAIAFASWRARHTTSSHSTSDLSSVVEIRDSGSTNFAGWDLVIYSNGDSHLNCYSGPQLHTSCNASLYKTRTISIGTLQTDLATTQLSSQYDCIRSASFGTVETLVYKNRSITGIDCYFSANPNTPLSKDLVPVLQNADLPT